IREHAATLREQLLLQIADARARSGLGASEPLQQILADHPTHEAAVQRLLLVYGQAGRRDAAARLWSQFSQTLGDELGLPPLPETAQIARAVETGRASSLPLADWDLLAYAPPIRVPLPFVPPDHATVGREEQLAVAERSARQVLDGAGRALLLSGMAGIGKTHVALTLGARLSGQGWHVMAGTASRYERHTAYGPLIEALSTYLRFRQDLTLDSLATQALAHLLGAALPPRYAVAAVGQLNSELLLHLGVLRVFEAAAERAPLLLVLDDVQWADQSTRMLISFVLRRLGSLRMLLLICYRPAELHDDGLLQEAFHVAERQGSLGSLPLEGISPEAATHFLHAVIGGLVLPRRAARDLIQRAAGNPFFLQELARAWVLSADRETAPLPTAIVDAVHLRLGRLSPAARSVAEVGALAETLFTPAVVGAIRHLAPAVVDQAIAELTAEQIAYWHGDGSLRFDHALIAEVLANALPAHTRARLHSALGRFAQTLEPPPPAGTLLYHFVAGRGGPEDDRAIARYGIAAGNAATALWALDDARAAYGHSLAALRRSEGGAGEWCQAWLGMARVEFEQGNYAAAVAAYAAVAAHAAHDPVAEAQRLAGQGWIDYRQSSYAAAVEHFGAAERIAPAGAPVMIEARIGRAFVLHLTGQPARAMDLLEQVLAANPDSAPLALRARVLNVLAAIHMENGQIAAAQQHFAAGMDCAIACGDIQYHALMTLNLANLNIRAGSLARALELSASVERIARDLHNHHQLGRAYLVLSWALFYTGDLDGAAARIEQALPLLPADSQEHVYALNHLTAVRREQHNLAAARDLARQALEMARQGGYVLAECAALCDLARIGLEARDTDGALLEGWAREALALAQSYQRPAWSAICWVVLGRTLAAQGDPQAEAAFASGIATAQDSHGRTNEIEGRLARAEWLLGRERPSEAEAELAVVDDLARQAGALLFSRKAAALQIASDHGRAWPPGRPSRRPARVPEGFEEAVLAAFDANPGQSLRAIARAVAAARNEPPRNHHTIHAILKRNGRTA
ncbi:MAG TPA: AAA family ATPase, partial [Herpetosiphonaceae bacterium]|nr:AAA family ATPase [Herpetosiphonaceae bacterium]